MAGLKPVDDAINLLLDAALPIEDIEQRALDRALNCYAAQDIVSPLDVPPEDNSAMDGYAICLADVEANPELKVVDRIAAGYSGKALVAGTAARIFTGAPVPVGADTVVMQENTELNDAGVRITNTPKLGENIRRQGQDIRSGSTIIKKGERLSAQHLGLAASIGLTHVPVFRPLKVAILSTGDELKEPGETLAPGQIFNSNRYVLSGLIREMNMDVVDIGIVRDDPETTEAALLSAAEQADVVISSGGVSVGEEDHVKGAVERNGSIELWKLAIKPGKPLAFGDIQGVPFFGLPGNPVSTFVTFLVVAKPYLRKVQGAAEVFAPELRGVADFEFSGGSRREYLRVRTELSEDGQLKVSKFPSQGSGILTSVTWGDGLAVVEIDQKVSAGDPVRVMQY